MSSNHNSRFAAYRHTLAAISKRTGTPLPSLIISFGVLHELTAVVPLVGFFYGARMLGVGERVVGAIIEDEQQLEHRGSWAKQKMRTWVEEGDRWAIRIGRRYGVFGFEKRAAGVDKDGDVEEILETRAGHAHLAGEVANAVFAYGATKALLPVRIGVSVYLSPMFSRSVIEPIRKAVVRSFRRGS